MIGLTDPISYNGENITDIAGWTTTGTTTYSYPNKNLTTYDLAQSDKASTTSAFYSGRKINVEGIIALNTREALDDALSDLRNLTDYRKKLLQLPVGGEQREFKDVTLENMITSEVGGGKSRVILQFVADDLYSYDLVSTELLNELNETSGNQSYPIVVEGKGKQMATITYTVDSVTDGDSKTVSFIDPDSNTISIDRTWAAAEVLVIDCLNRTVEVDSSPVKFTGRFPEWRNGNRFLNYTDEFTARQVDINVVYTKRYI